MRPKSFDVVVKGTLGEPLLMAVQDGRGFTLTETREGNSHFTGHVSDQARLYGFLDALRDLGIELVSVNPSSS